ncbi:hypothetical protein LCGC14_2198160 [marine sediment metagenome]|uniref:Uncharacterized protein n=1 Tax=marine sediment metagenome TaxID=412755 RepID=A0A0F9GD88_9ZZZZ
MITAPQDCPGCHGPNDYIEYGFVEIDGPDVKQECSCQACGCAWTENYMYTSFTITQKGDTNESSTAEKTG